MFVDCTVGLGGHSKAMLEAGATRVIGLDRDPAALAIAAETLAAWRDRVDLVHSDYRAIEAVLDQRGIARIDGALADLGMSSLQLEAEGRGFSFQREDPLDMRMDTTTGVTAADLLRDAEESEIADAIYRYGEERFSRRIARSIVYMRAQAPIETTLQLASIVRRAIPAARIFAHRSGHAHVSGAPHLGESRAGQGLDEFLAAVAERLQTGARMVIITFHLARGSHREAHDARAGAARARVDSRPDEEAGAPPAGRDRTEPARAQRKAAGGGTYVVSGFSRTVDHL